MVFSDTNKSKTFLEVKILGSRSLLICDTVIRSTQNFNTWHLSHLHSVQCRIVSFWYIL